MFLTDTRVTLRQCLHRLLWKLIRDGALLTTGSSRMMWESSQRCTVYSECIFGIGMVIQITKPYYQKLMMNEINAANINAGVCLHGYKVSYENLIKFKQFLENVVKPRSKLTHIQNAMSSARQFCPENTCMSLYS